MRFSDHVTLIAGEDTVLATFRPQFAEDLTAAARTMVGQRREWLCVGASEPDEMFPGQSRWAPNPPVAGVGWVPFEDLVEIEATERS